MEKTVLKKALYLLFAVAAVAACFILAPIDRAAAQNAEGVTHIFTHELVFDTAKAYSPNNSLRNCFDKDHLTSREFRSLLDGLYKNDYVLVSIPDALSGKACVPSGKRPFTLSFDDMTYDTVNRGCVDKVIIDGGKVCDYTRSATPTVTRERENVCILEKFIEEHPDFAQDGARPTLCLNGYNGILGYRISPDCAVSEKYRAREIEEAKRTVAELKRLGYSFASHTYYHSYFDSVSAERLEKDCAMWKKYIEPVVGETRMLCFPAGKHSVKSPKFDIFRRYGFDTFLCVGAGATEYEKTTGEAFVYRKPFDGTALRLYRKAYADIVDTAAIYDTSRFRPFGYKGGY